MWEDRRGAAKGARLITSVLMLLVLITACKSDDNAPEEPEERSYPGVDERLWTYFERFELNAQERGVTVDLVQAGITGVIEPIAEQNVAGTCNFNRNTANHVMVDEQFWNRAGDLFREFIVFHELGHCFLFRDHLEEEDQFGRCVSIMRSGTGDCRDNYSATTRQPYINELFDEQRRNDIFGN